MAVSQSVKVSVSKRDACDGDVPDPIPAIVARAKVRLILATSRMSVLEVNAKE